MRPLLVVIPAAAVVALALAGQSPARTSCTPGTHTSSGVTYRTFCGPAHATVHVGGKTFSFTGGSCIRDGSTFSINVGTITLPPGKPKYKYFGITVFTGKDGTFANQAIGWQFPDGTRGSLFHAKIVLKNGRTQGTFSGTTLADSKPGSGTFHC